MRVLTWNIWWRFGPWPERFAAITAVLGAQNPDIVMLQEAIGGTSRDHQNVSTLARDLGMHLVTTQAPERGGDVMVNAILSRWPIESHQQFSLTSAPGRPNVRTILLARVATPWGTWPMVTTHLDHRFDESHVRRVQVDELADVVADELTRTDGGLPAIVGGDLNAVPDSDEIRRLTGRTAVRHPNLVFADAWELSGTGSGHTWSSANPYLADANWPNRRIDYLFVTWPRVKPAGHPVRTWLAGNEPVDAVMASDHFAVVADLRVPEVDSRA